MIHFNVTAENIDQVREEMGAIDQRKEVEPGCEVWTFRYEGGQTGQITTWPHNGRAAICHGGDSMWGEWDADARTITLEDLDEEGRPIVYDENGDRVSAE